MSQSLNHSTNIAGKMSLTFRERALYNQIHPLKGGRLPAAA